MNNLTNTAKKLDKIFEIASIVLGALAIASAVFIVLIGLGYVLKWDPEFIGTGYASFNVGFLELEAAPGYGPDPWVILGHAAFTLAVGILLLLDGRRGIGYVRGILQPMTEDKPFDSSTSINLKKLAKLSIRIGILWNIIKLSEMIVMVFVYDLPGLLLSEKISYVSGMCQVDLTFLVYWAILTLLSYVFQHGQQLQQLSDETL
ncbi:MAG: hypothetical protein IIW56_03505 [Oscillospiraceae bacterium]|nr:hypothetical protein [Oscillospiraceae bacterium]